MVLCVQCVCNYYHDYMSHRSPPVGGELFDQFCTRASSHNNPVGGNIIAYLLLTILSGTGNSTLCYMPPANTMHLIGAMLLYMYLWWWFANTIFIQIFINSFVHLSFTTSVKQGKCAKSNYSFNTITHFPYGTHSRFNYSFHTLSSRYSLHVKLTHHNADIFPAGVRRNLIPVCLITSVPL